MDGKIVSNWRFEFNDLGMSVVSPKESPTGSNYQFKPGSHCLSASTSTSTQGMAWTIQNSERNQPKLILAKFDIAGHTQSVSTISPHHHNLHAHTDSFRARTQTSAPESGKMNSRAFKFAGLPGPQSQSMISLTSMNSNSKLAKKRPGQEFAPYPKCRTFSCVVDYWCR